MLFITLLGRSELHGIWLTPTLHKIFSTGHAGKLVWVAFSGQMLDAGYWMLDIQECTYDEIQNIGDPETSIQDQPILARVFVATVFIATV